MKPLRIHFELCAHMRVPERPIHLDSILHELIAVRMAVRSDAPESQETITAELDRILDRDKADPAHVYKASVLRFQGPFVRSTEMILRRSEAGKIADDQISGFLNRNGRLINLGSGRERQFQEFMPLVWPREIVADCVADEERLRDLLGDLTHIGSGRRNGHGEIACMRIEPGSRDGWKARTYSTPGGNRIRMIGRYAPPYFLRDARAVTWVEQEALMEGLA